MWELLQAELRDERDRITRVQDSFRERRISDRESLEDHFARLNSMVNDRFIEFDERIHRFNEKRAGSLSMQLAETIRHIKQYPDALQQIQINISNAEACIAAVEQNATHRIEESNRVLIDHLATRILHLEDAHVRRAERTQFFDISDHDGDIQRPADLPPVPGALFPGGHSTAIPRSSLLGPVDHGSTPGCNAAPAEKASTVQSQTSCPNLDEILRRAQQRMEPDVSMPDLTTRALSRLGKGPSRWYNAMLGRSSLEGDSATVRPFFTLKLALTLWHRMRLFLPRFGQRLRMLCHRCPPSTHERPPLRRALRFERTIRSGTVALLAVTAPMMVVRMAPDSEVVDTHHPDFVPVEAVVRRATGNPPGTNDSGPGASKGDGSLSDAKKAKCKSFRLDSEPEPAQLRRWIVDMKKRVANAFADDPGYALTWVEIPDGSRYEDLIDECKYGMLENECNSAFRECIKSIALKNKIQTETERMDTINRYENSAALNLICSSGIEMYRRRCILQHDHDDHPLLSDGMLRPRTAVPADPSHDQRGDLGRQDAVTLGEEVHIGGARRDVRRRGDPLRGVAPQGGTPAAPGVPLPLPHDDPHSGRRVAEKSVTISRMADAREGLRTRLCRIIRYGVSNGQAVLLDDVDAKTLGSDACVLELTLSKHSACEVLAADTRSLPCRWTGRTIFVIGPSAKTQVKVRTSMPSKDGTERRVETANGYYGHALRAKARCVIPAKSRACIVTDLEFDPPIGMSARDVAVVQFYTSVLAAVELEFSADNDDSIAVPARPSKVAFEMEAANLVRGWELMASKIKLEPPSSIKRYLGCEHVTFSHVVPGPFDPRSYWTHFEEPKKAFPELTFGDRNTNVAQGSTGPREIRMIKYDMRSFMEQCVSRYVELCGPKYKATLRSADTPFPDESRPEFDVNPNRPAVTRLLGHPADTPIPPDKGELGDCAAVLMKILYGARMGRYDLIRPVQALASLITKWDGLCDKKLHRLVCYINSFMPLNALSKKQTSGSKSTPEAEIVSLDHAVYKLGLPALSMWEYMLGHRFRLRVMDDNEAAIRVIITGHNPNMRHMSRTQRIDISALNERYHGGDFLFVTCPSQFEAGDILTKACTDAKVCGVVI
ncbi:unnamed protein product [Symbiodinium sp. CCMP2592]|nr:unnamed protein product [Symbiodinium sp. CCMP2592]